jgi:hypothetical protein
MDDINISELYKTYFCNLLPNRGFLVSAQPYAPSIDIDLKYDTNFKVIKIIESDNKPFIYVRNGPFKVCPYQGSFSVECENTETLEYFDSCKFYIKRPNYKILRNSNLGFEEIVFNKTIESNKIIYSIDPEAAERLSKKSRLYCAPENEFTVRDSFKIYINTSKSTCIYYKEGIDPILDHIDQKFIDFNLSGSLYETKNGLRIFLSDKFRDVSKDENVDEILPLLKEFYLDEALVFSYKIKSTIVKRKEPLPFMNDKNRLEKYLARLTPKIKYYEQYDNRYVNYVDSLLATEAAPSVEPDTVPLKYDFKNVTYSTGTTDELIEDSFSILNNMITGYLQNDAYAVCKYIKSYSYAEIDPRITEFLQFHDNWTKSSLQNAILI